MVVAAIDVDRVPAAARCYIMALAPIDTYVYRGADRGNRKFRCLRNRGNDKKKKKLKGGNGSCIGYI